MQLHTYVANARALALACAAVGETVHGCQVPVVKHRADFADSNSGIHSEEPERLRPAGTASRTPSTAVTLNTTRRVIAMSGRSLPYVLPNAMALMSI